VPPGRHPAPAAPAAPLAALSRRFAADLFPGRVTLGHRDRIEEAIMRRSLSLSFLLAAIAPILALSACGGGGGGGGGTTEPPPPGGNNTNTQVTVTVGKSSFNPTAVSVSPQGKVTWRWNTCSTASGGDDPYGGGGGSTTTCVAHNVKFDDGPESGTQETGAFSRTFATAGTYNYHCVIHGAAMSGTVTVQ
jgi:plastocyanin